jgi:TupA-like ATPgrasp
MSLKPGLSLALRIAWPLRSALRLPVRLLWDWPGCRSVATTLLRAHCWLDFVILNARLPNQPDRRFNDFLYGLKTGDEILNPLRQRISDKAEAKTYISACLGQDATLPTLAVLNSAEDIRQYRPSQYPIAVKPTHSSGRWRRITSDTEWQDAQDAVCGWLAHDFFRRSLERNYDGLPKRVIVEPWLHEAFRIEGSVHCRDGRPKVVSIIERYSKERQSYTPDRAPLGISLGFPLRTFDLTDWDFFDPVLQAAAKLSAGLSYIRVDFYTDGTHLLFGELTNLPAGGRGRFYPDNGEEIFSKAFFADGPA